MGTFMPKDVSYIFEVETATAEQSDFFTHPLYRTVAGLVRFRMFGRARSFVKPLISAVVRHCDWLVARLSLMTKSRVMLIAKSSPWYLPTRSEWSYMICLSHGIPIFQSDLQSPFGIGGGENYNPVSSTIHDKGDQSSIESPMLG